MTQEQLKEQFISYYENNLNNKTALEGIKEILESIINDICYDYPNESNKLTTCYLIIKELIENDNY